MTLNYINFNYNTNNSVIVSKTLFGPDGVNGYTQNKITPLFDSFGVRIGNATFVQTLIYEINSDGTVNPNNACVTEYGTYFIDNNGTVAYLYDTSGTSTSFLPGQTIVRTALATGGKYFENVEYIAINAFEAGARQVWISFY